MTMRFSFNPESDFERELIDRCIEGELTVQLRVDAEETLEFLQEHGLTNSPAYEEFDCVILERHDGLMSVTVVVANDLGGLAGKRRIDTDNIQSIHVY